MAPPKRPRRELRSRTSLQQLRSSLDLPDGRTKEGKSRAKKREFVIEARETFEQWAEADRDQRERESSDEAFYALEHWPADIKLARAGQDAANGIPAIPARPCLVIDKLSEPVNQVLNQERDAEINAALVPADDFEGLGVVLDDKEITLREGFVRRIQRESQASMARSWAFKRAVIAGRGYYGVMTRRAPGKTFDKELYVTGWYNQSCVTLDPSHEQPDGSDAEGGFIGRWMKWTDYKLRWPDADDRRNLISSLRDTDFVALGNEAPNWFKVTETSKGHLRMVYVVDYFYTVKTSRVLCELADGRVEWKDEYPGEDADIVQEDDVIEHQIKWAILDGANPEPLEETDWEGPDIPIVKVLGEEVLPFNDERRIYGMVRPSRDPNQGFDAMASKLVEQVAYAPIPSVMMAVGQDEGVTKEWDLSTTRNMGRLHYNIKDADGNMAGPPIGVPRGEAPIQPIAMSLTMFSDAVDTTTRHHESSVGKSDPAVRSSKMSNALIEQAAKGSSNFLNNLKTSVRYETQIINNLLYPIYGKRPGRLAKIVNGQGNPETVMLGQPYVMQGKRPMALPPNVPTPENGQHYTLTEHANCNIAITITRNYETRRQEQEAFLGGIIGADPALMSVYGDLLFQHSDGPGHEEMAERAKLMLAPPVQAYLAAKKAGKPFDPAAQQQLAEAKQMMDQAQKEIQELQQKLSGKVVEQQGKLAITKEQESHEDMRAAMDREVKIAVAEITAQAKQALQDMALFYEERGRIGAQIHEAAQGGKELAHDAHLAHVAAITDAGQATLEHNQTLEQQAAAHQQTLEQGQQSAALAPPPTADTGAA